MLEVKNLSCVRQNKPIFSDLSFTLSAGNLLLIKGINGSGKSTLLKALAGLASHSGTIVWQPTLQAHYLNHQNGLKLDLTVTENIALRLALQETHVDQQRFKNVVITLKLDSLLNKTIRTLSAGQQRRVALSLLWLVQKPIWLLDEPLTSMDEEMEKLFTRHLNQHLQQGGSAVISTHQPFIELSSDYQTLVLNSAIS